MNVGWRSRIRRRVVAEKAGHSTVPEGNNDSRSRRKDWRESVWGTYISKSLCYPLTVWQAEKNIREVKSLLLRKVRPSKAKCDWWLSPLWHKLLLLLLVQLQNMRVKCGDMEHVKIYKPNFSLLIFHTVPLLLHHLFPSPALSIILLRILLLIAQVTISQSSAYFPCTFFFLTYCRIPIGKCRVGP